MRNAYRLRDLELRERIAKSFGDAAVVDCDGRAFIKIVDLRANPCPRRYVTRRLTSVEARNRRNLRNLRNH